MAHSKIVYIYIEGLDFKDELTKQKQKHSQKGEAGEFIFVKYKGKGQFEYTQNGVNVPGLPPIDEDTKIVVMGHGVPKSNQLSQLANGGGIQLTAQTVADAITIPAGQCVQFSVRGCKTGVGRRSDSHEDSFAGQLFTKLSAKGLKPTISASLSFTWMMDTGQLGRFAAMGNSSSNNMGRDYERLARDTYQESPEKLDGFEKFQIIQRNRRIIRDSKAQGSKVVLTREAGSMKASYPYGHPNEEFDVSKLSDTGKALLPHLLSKEALFIQKFKTKMEKVKEELSRIFIAYEAELEGLDMKPTNEYSQLKQFLLEEDYYFDIKIIERWSLDRHAKEGADCYTVLANKINESVLLRDFEINSADIEEVYHSDGKSERNLDLAYLQFGLEIVSGQVNYSSPISQEQLELLDAPTRQALLIALGKQMMVPDYLLDSRFVQECIVQVDQRIAELGAQRSEEKLYWESGIESLREEGLEEIYTQLLDKSVQQKFVMELGKQREWQDCDQQFIENYKSLMRNQLIERGRALIYQEGGCQYISLKSFGFLETGEQALLIFLIGLRDLAGSLSENSQITMDSFIRIAIEKEQLAEFPQEKKESQVTSRFSFLPPVSSLSYNREDRQREDLIRLDF